MSMTKRHLESLPEAEQNAILGPVNDEWMDGPTVDCADCHKAFPEMALNGDGKCDDCHDRDVAAYVGLVLGVLGEPVSEPVVLVDVVDHDDDVDREAAAGMGSRAFQVSGPQPGSTVPMTRPVDR